MKRKAKIITKDFEFKQITLKEDTVALMAGNPEKYFWDIPETVTDTKGKAYSVVAIDDEIVYTATNVLEMKIPRTVTELGRMAFSHSLGLQAIHVDENNEKYASLDGVVYSKDLSALISFPVGKYTPNFQIPASVRIIADWAFLHCGGIIKLDVPEGVTSIGAMAFSTCLHLLEIRLPKSLKNLGLSPFTADRLLSVVIAPDNPFFEIRDGKWLMTKAGDRIYQGIGINDKIVKVPENVQKLGSYSLAFNEEIEEVFLPKGLKVIGQEALYHCSRLKKVHIPRSLKMVSWNAFGDCPRLSPPHFPANAVVASDVLEQSEMSGFVPIGNNAKVSVDNSPF